MYKKLFRFLHYIKMLNWLPDYLFLKAQFRAYLGTKLNLNDPKTFNEKLNWLKLHDRKPIYTKMVDKLEAKKYVQEIVGSEYIVKTLGVFNDFDEIDFDSLPEKFVIKCTHDSGGLAICKDKRYFDKNNAKVKIERSLKNNYFWNCREWPYKNVPHKIIVEEFLPGGENGLIDYKFYCFNGEPLYLYVSEGMDNHVTAKMSFLTMDWEFAPFGRSDFLKLEELPEKPSKFDEMVVLAKKLSKDLPFLRVDLYQVKEKVYFSELTFSPCGGYMPFEPIEYDRKLGDMLEIIHNESTDM